MLTDKQKKELSIPARETMQIIDNYLDFVIEKTVKIKVLQLYHERWDELETSISRVTKGKKSLKEDTYRGMQIVSWEGNE